MTATISYDVAEAPPLRTDESRRSRLRPIVVAAATVSIAIVAFIYRFNTPEGSLGGFSNDQFAHLMRAEMLLRGQQPLRDFADAELRGAWPALSYAIPAWAQQIGGRTLLSEACVTLGALALAHALVFPLALGLSRRWWLALLATAVAIVTAPRAYSYPKVLTLALGIIVVRLVMSEPSTLALALAAVVTALATLFRHDCGVYVAIGVVTGLLGLNAPWRVFATRLTVYAGFTSVWLLPSAIWVHKYEGIPSYIRNTLVTVVRETDRTKVELPALWTLSPSSSDGLVGLSYYAFWMVLVVAAVVLVIRVLDVSPLSAADRATAVGLLAMAFLANHFLMRGSLSQRIGDAAIPVVALAAWSAGAALDTASSVVRRIATVVPVVLLLFMFAAAASYGEVVHRLDESGLAESWNKTAARFAAVSENLRQLPPVDWSGFETDTSLPQAARYVAQCTTPDDYLLVAAEAPEVHVFARRRFAAGQPALAMGLYTSETDQRRALARLRGQTVPIVLADAARFETEFIWTYPLIAQYVKDHYRQAGTIDERFLVFVDANRPPRRLDPHSGLPCFQ